MEAKARRPIYSEEFFMLYCGAMFDEAPRLCFLSFRNGSWSVRLFLSQEQEKDNSPEEQLDKKIASYVAAASA
jgi:hypothetical protein